MPANVPTKSLAAALACLVLAGCANLRPDHYRPPTQAELAAAGQGLYTGPVNGTLEQYVTYTDNLTAWHESKAMQLRTGNGVASEVGFLAAVVGVVAGATEHLQSARNALGVGAATSVFSDRYRLAAQAAAYEGAAAAFLCMRDRLADARSLESGLEALAKQNLNLLSVFPDVGNQVRDSTVAVSRKLQVKLRTMDVSTPDLTKLRDALNRSPDTPRGTGFTTMTANMNADAITKLRGNLQACEALFN